MKKYISALILFWVFLGTNVHACDQVFDGGMLRYDYGYTFYDKWNNGENRNVYLNNYKVNFVNPSFLDKGSSFAWTKKLKDNGYKVNPYHTMRVLETGARKRRIAKYPATRTNGTRNSYDFGIEYTIDYDYSNNYPDSSDDISHKECVYYSVSWCGDGVIDTKYGETCDPKAPGYNESNCDPETCEPIKEEEKYDLALNKKVVGNGPFHTGDEVEFKINVYNQGNLKANNIEITDYIPSGFELISTDWTKSGNKATKIIGSILAGKSKILTIKFKIKSGVTGKITNWAEISKDDGNDCDSTPDSNKDNDKYTTDDYIGNVCDGGNGDEDDHDPAEITVESNIKYDLALNKKVVGNGPFHTGDEVEFKINVYNQGNVKANNIEITDYIPSGFELVSTDWTKSGNKATKIIGSILAGKSKTLTIKFKIKSGVIGEIINWAEISKDDGNDCDSTPDSNKDNDKYTTDDYIGNGCDGGNGDEDDHDPAEITVSDGGVEVDKTDANSDDEDGVVGNDTQTVEKGDKAIFKITVKNGYTEALKEINVTDEKAPKCGGKVELPGTYPSTWSNFKILGSGNHSNNLLEVGEYFEYTCEGEETQGDYTNVVKSKGKTITGEDTPEDDDESEVKVLGIQIDKTDSNSSDKDGIIGNDTQTVNKGSKSEFKIRVTNNGEESLKDLKLTDTKAPKCGGDMTLPSTYPNTWKNFTYGGSGNHTNDILEVGEWFEYTCEKTNTQSNYTNVAKVEGKGVESGKTVSDDDDSEVKIDGGGGPIPNINVDKRDANPDDQDGTIGNDTQTVSKGNKAVFKIKVTNSYRFDLKNIVLTDSKAPNCEGSILPGTRPSTWNDFRFGGLGDHTNDILEVGEWFEYTCEKSNTQSDYTNIIKVTGKGGPNGITLTDEDDSDVDIPGGGGGGGSGPECIRISIPALENSGLGKSLSSTGSVDITCYGDSRSAKIGIDCDYDGGAPDIDYYKNSTYDGSLRYARFTCDYTNMDSVPNPKCYVAPASANTFSISSLSCGTRISVGRNYCGDGVLQRPNDDGLMEECEAQNGVFPDWCVNCKTTNFTIPGGAITAAKVAGVLTYPGEGKIIIKPFGKIVIGAGTNPFNVIGSGPYISNDSGEDLYFDHKLCVYNEDSSVILNKTNSTNFEKICSKHKIGWLYPGVKKTFKGLNDGVSIKIKGARITGNVNYKDTELKISLEGLKDAYFSSSLKVRVSKPAIGTIGGGTSYLGNGGVSGDVSDISTSGYGDEDKNKNFVGVGLSASNISSYTSRISNNNVITGISSGHLDKVNSGFDNVGSISTTGEKRIGDSIDYYNGLTNVYIVKGGNLIIDNDIVGDNPRTYIVEDGDLIIEKDINYGKSLAFVVKGGDIKIKSNVKNINATLITIEKDSRGGNIKSELTNNKLIVNGNLYGNLEHLVGNRTYISNKDGVINVGTVVRFGSSLFRKQAPLVGDFVGEYMESKKEAR